MKHTLLAALRRISITVLLAGMASQCLAQYYDVHDPATTATLHNVLAARTPPTTDFGQLMVAPAIVAAHRGLFDATHPENTIQSINNAVTHNIEAMELDVYESSDGIPYLMHDQTLYRMTLDNRYSDIYRWQREGSPAGLQTPTFAQISALLICQNGVDGHGVTVDNPGCNTSAGITAPSLAFALDIIDADGYTGLVVLDLRETGDIVDTAVQLLHSIETTPNPAWAAFVKNQVILKFQTTYFASPNDFANQVISKGAAQYGDAYSIDYVFQNLMVQPVYTSNTVATKETAIFNWAVNDWANWQFWFGEYNASSNLISPLVGLKSPLAVLNTPQDDLFTTIWQQGRAVGVYVPVAECTNPNPSTAASNISGSQGVYIEHGACGPITPPMNVNECGLASQQTYDQIRLGCADHRPFFQYWHDVAEFGFIITDDPIGVINALDNNYQRPGDYGVILATSTTIVLPPKNVSVSAAASGSVTLTWTASANPIHPTQTDSSVTQYTIYGGPNVIALTAGSVCSANTCSETIAGLTAGHTYNFYITASAGSVFSIPSNNVSYTALETSQILAGNAPSPCASVMANNLDSNGVNTSALQAAIDQCAQANTGNVSMGYVELSGHSGNSFTSGALYLASNVGLWIDPGVTLNASTKPALFQRTAATRTASCFPPATIPPCATLNATSTSGCDALINGCRVNNSGVLGSGTIEGHGWDVVNDNQSSLGSTWWARSATSKAGRYAVSLNAPEMIEFTDSSQVSVQGVTVQNAPRYEITLDRVNTATISNINIHTPTSNHVAQGPAYNTDGIDPVSSSNVLISNVTIASGDDNIAIKTSDGPATNITVQNATLLGPGHGLSIGSQTSYGVSNVTATNVNMIGTVNGLRIKSSSDRGGTVSNIKYDHVCMLGVKNPIDLDPAYKDGGTGTLYPNFRSVEMDNVYANGGNVIMKGYSTSLPLNLTLNNVIIGGLGTIAAANANISEILDPNFPHAINVASDTGGQVTQTTGQSTIPGGIQAYCNTNNVRHPTVVSVDQSGSGNFTTIQAAVNAAPADGSVIWIHPGTYREVVTVTTPFIQMIGTGANNDPTQVVITYNNSAGTLDSTGAIVGTSKSATFFAKGDDFYMRNLTIQNTFDEENGQDAVNSQAVALYASGDRGVYRNIRVLGRQDTLYVNNKGCDTTTAICQPSRQYFANSYIEGNVDFVFGGGRAFFDSCELHSVMHDYPSGEVTMTAQSREYANEDSGYVFNNSRFTQDPGLTNVWLGRPWKPYSTVILLNTNIASPIVPAGYQEWVPGTTHYLWTAWYGEYNSTGPGAAGPREQWEAPFNATQAGWYSFNGFMAWPDNWVPPTTP